jgi:hypothetical protein
MQEHDADAIEPRGLRRCGCSQSCKPESREDEKTRKPQHFRSRSLRWHAAGCLRCKLNATLHQVARAVARFDSHRDAIMAAVRIRVRPEGPMGKFMVVIGLVSFLFLLDPQRPLRQLDYGLTAVGWKPATLSPLLVAPHNSRRSRRQ